MPSFDIASRPAMNEVQNALQQAQKELAQRFDFRGTETSLEQTDEGIVLKSTTEQRIAAALEVLKERLIKRQVSLKFLDPTPVGPGPAGTFRQLVKLKQGIPVEAARKIVAHIKDLKLKVQGSIQQDQVRVAGKNKDDLQACIRAVRTTDFGLELQVINLRD